MFTENSKQKIMEKWTKKLENGHINYDPEYGISFKKIGIYIVNYLPGRLRYLQDNPPTKEIRVNTPHSKQDAFCSQWDAIEKQQKISDIKLRHHTWRILANNSPIEKYHCVMIPDGDPHNQTMTLPYFEDLAILAESNNNIFLGFNSFGAAASQNHFHFHLFFNRWSEKTINSMPIKRKIFKLQDVQGAIEYTSQLVNQNIGHNITMSNNGIVITKRRVEQIDGIRYGVDAISGRFLTTSPEQYKAMNINLINAILDQIAFLKEEK